MKENDKLYIFDSVSLKEHFERRLDDMDKATKIALAANDRRLDGMNEFRDALKDQASQFALKREFDDLHKEVQGLQEFKAELKGKASHQSVLIANILAVIAILVSIAHYLR